MLTLTLPNFVFHDGNLGLVWAMAPFLSLYDLHLTAMVGDGDSEESGPLGPGIPLIGCA